MNRIQKGFLVLALISGLFIPQGCKSTYQYDKKRIVIFTFGVGLTLISDKEAELEAEVKDQGKEGEANGR